MARCAAAMSALALLTGCSGSDGDKAGGVAEGKPVVLTLESEDDVQLSGAPEFAEAVERLSAGSVRIVFAQAGRGTEIDFERGVVEDVRSGRADLGIVGARVWDTMGVTSFQALLAPMLVDSYDLELKVLESPLARRMLEGVEEAGVVGVALLPGPLRRPFGLSRPLLDVQDYRGATIGIRPGGVAAATFRALGATPKGYVPGVLTGADGAELDPTTIAYNDFDRHALTANVILWPKPYSIVMNREAFDALTPEQQTLLRRAGDEALAPELSQIERDEASAFAELCRGGELAMVHASASERVALRSAVQGVYEELQRDSVTKELIAKITSMRRGALADAALSPRCPAASRTSATTSSALEGHWETTWTREDLVAGGIAPRDAEALAGHHTAEFEDGRFRFRGDPGSGKAATGAYSIDGDVLRLVFRTGFGLQLGRTYELRWSVFRDDSLTFAAVPGSEPLQAFLVEPYTRIR